METLRISVPTLVEAVFGRVTSEVCDQRLHSWSRRVLDQAEVKIEVFGLEHIQPREQYVVMSNHQSHYDIPVLFQALGVPIRMVAKRELYKIPIFAHAMRAAGFIEIDRRDRDQAIRALRSARESLHETVSIWIAPEGTRSRSGRLAPFKKGGFYLALQTGLRILPVTITGTRDILPADGLHVTRGRSVRVQVSPPIDPNAYGSERRDELVLAVRSAIEQHLPPQMRGLGARG